MKMCNSVYMLCVHIYRHGHMHIYIYAYMSKRTALKDWCHSSDNEFVEHESVTSVFHLPNFPDVLKYPK